ncbi:AzlC family ABC transporter permease [Paracoccus sp. 1_MG-2023]|uniref:AzlC family ABC transporter permease n=1 Tax=unclassified Paracoccus (in: a-proteobacteria) TaxID=2688777 RepID=UPI001C092922|nr:MULTISPECIES: AzlC family ABC transporter permease [unclassified Paracoccus (in: a-proteobacteria)]MBU2956969.1 AzlC family ABC transporter permease [Paracoccus sp. C2R09]MDO6668166.1 AzlC family ABC transporter permease [Paracoccus sp. 1_MG-2023]
MSPTPEPRPDPAQETADPITARALARTPRQAFWHGMWQSLPFLIVIVPFALLFGVVASEAGLDLAQVMGFSVLVLAGASQFTAVQLMSDNAPAIIVILSSLAVNLRMAMYSASLVPWLGNAAGRHKAWIAYVLIDQSYALSIQHYERHPRLSMPQRLAYFAGCVTPLCIPWMIATGVGAVIGNAMPEGIALDFALPITFLAMIAPMLRTPAHLAACFTAILSALLLAGLPSGLGLLIAAPLGMIAGAVVETRTTPKEI